MKQLSQIIAVYLFGLNAIQIILVLGTAAMLVQILVNRLSLSKKIWQIKKRNREIENNIWAIE